MSQAAGERTHATYQQKDVVDLYDNMRDLQPAERELFEAYVKPGLEVLDIGVGAGRTTRFLAPGAKRYVGVDYAAAMVERCKERFPGLEFDCVDATDMSRYADESFDVVVFSFNGLGTLPTDEGRDRCLRECSRVLRKGGTFIFSLHNPKFVLYQPVLADAGALKKVWRLTYAALQTTRNLRHRIPSRAFWGGTGYVTDPGQHNALTIWVCDPDRVRDWVAGAGLEMLRTVAAPDARRTRYSTPHYYYACRKPR